MDARKGTPTALGETSVTSLRCILASLLAFVCVNTASADFIWTEVGDAGSTLATAQHTVGLGAMTAISGSFVGASDADLYRFTLSTPATFSATTVGGTGIDTQLFLFNVDGFGIAANDDTGPPLQSTLPAGNALYATLPAGTYILGVSTYDTDPTNGAGELFPDAPFTSIFGPTGPGGAFPMAGFAGGGSGAAAYTLTVTAAGASTPAPAAFWMALAGAGALGALRRRFRKA
jgi:MYXO-CTERM domain-containing protein